MDKFNIFLIIYYRNHKMILRSRRIISHFLSLTTSRMLCSNSKLDPVIEVLEHKAYLASKIISTINSFDINLINAQQTDKSEEMKKMLVLEVKKQPLAKKLLSMIEEEGAKHGLKQEAVQHMKSFFTTGVKFDKRVFNQQRITSNVIGGNTIKKTKEDYIPKFRFFPTYTVTGMAFIAIQKNYLNSSIFTGHYGISKSVSFMLYSMLSSIIAQYNFKTFGVSTKLKDQIISVPKLIYYTYRSAPFEFQDDMKEYLLRQCPEIAPDKFQELLSDRKGIKKLLKYYEEKQIQLICLIDQINKYINQMRTLRILLTKKPEQLNDQQKEQFELLKRTRKNFIQSLKKIRKKIGPTHFLTSVNLQRSIVELQKLGDQDNHNSLDYVQFKYLKQISQQAAIFQIVDCFLFLIEQKLDIKIPSIKVNMEIADSNSQEQKSKTHYANILETKNQQNIILHQNIRNILVEYLYNLQGNYVLTFYSMSKALYKKKDEFSSGIKNSLSSKEYLNLQTQMVNLLAAVVQQSKQQMRKKVDLFFRKQKMISERDSHLIKAKLFIASCDALSKNNKTSAYGKFEIDFNTKGLNISLGLVQQFIDRHLFEKFNGKYYSLIPAQFIVQILNSSMGQTFEYLAKHKLLEFLQYLDSSGFGKFMEKVFIKMLLNNQLEIRMLFGSNSQWKSLWTNFTENHRFKQIPKYEISKLISQQEIHGDKQKIKRQIVSSITKRIQIKKTSEKRPIFKAQFLPFITNRIEIFFQQLKKGIPMSPFTYVFLPDSQKNNVSYPLKKTKKTAEGIIQMVRLNDNTSKCIDLILLDFEFKDSNTITFNLIDVTKSADRTLQKITNFIEDFCVFSDMNEKETIISLKDGSMVKVLFKINYFVLAPGSYGGNLEKQLSKDFSNYLKFTSLYGKKDLCKVYIQNQPGLLETVGFLQIGQNLQVLPLQKDHSPLQGNYQMWKEIERQLKIKTKKID